MLPDTSTGLKTTLAFELSLLVAVAVFLALFGRFNVQFVTSLGAIVVLAHKTVTAAFALLKKLLSLKEVTMGVEITKVVERKRLINLFLFTLANSSNPI